ncbi:MAG: tRNA-dihydrouridine synthase family protein [Lachnospiraceae bacterium]|nr:tRNA-dihydrouridine synthase family protein [Cuneatibacter sp.]MDD6455111.1 tRNA-dihydrouridine synthase family protein [Lachnospiraceae bacterium]
MKLYLAPMEGVTGFRYRQTFLEYYGGVDRCFTPFVCPNQNESFITREKKEIAPENNVRCETIPQVLVARADHFLWAAGEFEKLGYTEMNLNLGCPSGTVVSKKKGSGFLAFPEELDAFLAEVYEKSPIQISIKTRLGRYEPQEWERLLAIFQKYPVSELILHPRVQQEMYRGNAHREWYRYTCERWDKPLCYNGDLNTVQDIQDFMEKYPDTDRIMLGRGLVRNPALARQAKGGAGLDKEEFYAFGNQLYHTYLEDLSGETPVLFKMKELWAYWADSFTDPDAVRKKIRKTQKCREYEACVQQIFARESLREEEH